ncbi:methyltransferase domain-containing protein [Acidobacteria bacterium AH-259-D05]|nr:methyltransferase domain-containing protein [Acidobacteria bacterium AH-259-D05]
MWSRIVEEILHWKRPHWSFADVGEHWDQTDRYDDINKETYSYFRRFLDGLRLSNIPQGAHILDFCARTGYGTLYFYQHRNFDSAVCADVSRRMGDICKRRLKENGFENFTWVQVFDYLLPFSDGEFDAVLCFETVEHFSHPERLVNELGRVTKAGGTLILTTPNVFWEPIHMLAAITGLHHSEGPHRFIRYQRLVDMVEKAGFEIERAETTVLIPAGPPLLIKLGEWLEEATKNSLMPWIGLRRVLICCKQ